VSVDNQQRNRPSPCTGIVPQPRYTVNVDVLIPGLGRPYVDGDMLDFTAPLAWTVPDIFDRAECAQMMARIDALGPEDAPITTSRGMVMRPDIRKNQRVMFDDAGSDRACWIARASTCRRCAGMQPIGVNGDSVAIAIRPASGSRPLRRYFARNERSAACRRSRST
jgi:hypothetical protein